jgi:3-phytase
MRRIVKLVPLFAVLAIGAMPATAQSIDTIAEVHARLETETNGASTKDDADDIAIWLDRNDPSKSLIIGTDKKRGLYVYGMDGRIRSHANSGKINNVDLRNDVMIDGQPRTVVAASDENQPDAMIAVYILDTETLNLVLLGRVSGGAEKPYGLCLYQQAGKLWAFNVFRNGLIEQVAIDISAGVVHATRARTMKLKGNAEGCVADDRTGTFYAAERDVGIWKWDAGPEADTRPVSVAKTDKSHLVADVEGLAIAAYGKDGGYLIASSQGADNFLLYHLPDNGYAGRFRMADGAIDGTSHTDGIELALGDFGPEYPGGLFVAQDDDNRPQPQNFKFVAWEDIVKVLHLAPDAPAAHEHH